VPWSHSPNRGFLDSVAALGRAAAAIGEQPEAQRCRDLLNDSSPDIVVPADWNLPRSSDG
jgi:hypothetical protein